MKLSSDILYNYLSRYVTVEYTGRHFDSLSLSMPRFYYESLGYQNDMVYLGRVGELPSPSQSISCLIVCVGGRFTSNQNNGNCCVFSILTDTDIFYIFNLLSEAFSSYDQWESDMRQILDGKADLAQMVKETANFFHCSISINDNQLRTVCRAKYRTNAYASEMSQHSELSQRRHRVNAGASGTGQHPELPQDKPASREISPASGHYEGKYISPDEAKTFAFRHHENIARREPFLYQVEEGICYCTNIYIHEVYWGLVTIECPDGVPSAGERAVFDYFYRLVYMTIRRLNRKENNLLITPKSVFLDLLNRMPVSNTRLQRIYSAVGSEKIRWQCYAIQPGSAMENLPLEYFCLQLEQKFPQCCAVPFLNYTVMFLPLRQEENEATYFEKIKQFFLECDLHAGVSYPFTELSRVHPYFRQAAIALKTLSENGADERIGSFREQALSIALTNSTGEFSPEMMIPPELLKLYKENTEYWQTLKCYLDNEMNATQTAKELFIHRTTLQARIHKIHQIIDLSTARKRMYIRYCMFLFEQMES